MRSTLKKMSCLVVFILPGMKATALYAAEESQPVLEQTAPDQAQMVESVRQELQNLREINLQLLQRIQQLESQLPAAAPRPAVQPPVQQVAEAPSPETVQQAQGEEDRRRAAESVRGVEDLVLEQHTLFNQSFSLELGTELTHFDRSHLALNGFLALDAIFLGDISIDEIDSTIVTTSLVARWGLSDRLQFSLRAPWLYRNTTTSSGGQDLSSITVTEESTEFSGFGDASAGVSFRLFPETLTRPDVVLNFSASAPTGKDPYGIKFFEHPANNNLQIPESLPTGSGLWGLTGGVSFLKSTDPAILFANFAYTHYLEEEFDDLSSDPALPPVPGSLVLGDQYQLGVGIAFAVNEETSFSMSFTQRFVEASTISRQGSSSQEIVGSETTSGTFDIGVTHALTEKLSVAGNLGIGLTQDASDYTFNLNFPYRF